QVPTLSPDGTLLAVAVQDAKDRTTIRLLDVISGTTRRDLAPAVTGRVLGIRISADGHTVLAAVEGEGKDELHAWRVADGEGLPAIDLKWRAIGDMFLTSDGQSLAVRGEDSILVFDTATGKQRYELQTRIYHFEVYRQTGYSRRGLLPATSPVAFSPDGKWLA